MIIGIDCDKLLDSHHSGTHFYLLSIIDALIKVDSRNTYLLLFSQNPPSTLKSRLALNQKCHIKVIPKVLSWTHFSLPMFCVLNSLDVLFCPWHTAPLFIPVKTKVVVLIHGLEHKKSKEFWVSNAIKRSDHIVTVSQFNQSRISTRYHITNSKITVIYEGLNVNNIEVSATPSIETLAKLNNTQDFLFFISSFVPRKNIPNMLEAFAKLIHSGDTYASYKFVLAGEIPETQTNYYKDILEQTGLVTNVIYLGPISSADAAYLFSHCRAFIFVSHEEGFGLPVLEAFHFKVPVVTSTGGALPEVSGGAALYANPDDPKDIYEKMRLVLEDAHLRLSLIKKGESRVKDFSWISAATELLEVFKDVYA